METTDLMIGDFVKVSMNQGAKVEYGRVANLDESGGIDVGVVGEPYSYWNLDGDDEILPIPLTPEIFKKSGFTLNEEENPIFTIRVYSLEADDVAVIQRPKGGWKFMHGKEASNQNVLFLGDGKFVCMPIQYVHELQHALRLCGIDKEITL